jgi:4-hydroxybenzoyl-CoA reductase subunit beta
MMRLPWFRHESPRSIAEAARMLAAEGPNAMLIAGGTDLLPNMKRRQQAPQVLVSLRRVDGMRTVANGTGLTLGAALTLTEVVDAGAVREHYRGLWQAASQVATEQLRNMGTLGGNLCLDTRCNYYDQNHEWRKAIDFCMKKDGATCWVATASKRCVAVSATDCAPALLALDARVRLVSSGGERVLPLADLYRNDGIDYLTRRSDEILVDVVLPDARSWRSSYWKLRRRGSFDFPVLGVAAAVKTDGGGAGRRLVAPVSHPGGRVSRRQATHRRRHRRGWPHRRVPGEADGQHRLRCPLAQAGGRGVRRLCAEGDSRRRHERDASAHRPAGAVGRLPSTPRPTTS